MTGRRRSTPPTVRMVYDGHMDALKKLALHVALFVAVWLLAAGLFGLLMWWTDFTTSPWYIDAIGAGLGVAAVTLYERMKATR